MKTVHNYIDVHRMTPVGFPVFALISDDESVVTEIGPDCIDSFDIGENTVSFNTTIFFYLNNPDWAKDRETTYTITYNQNFINPQTGETVLLEKKYHKMHQNNYSAYGSSATRGITYGYYFIDKELYNDLNKENKD